MPDYGNSEYDATYNKISGSYNGWPRWQALTDFYDAKGGDMSKLPGGGGGLEGLSIDSVGGSATDFATKNLFPMQDKAFSDYVMAQRAQEKPLDIYSRLEGEAGIPQMRKTASTLSGQVNDLEDSIRRVEGDVSANSRNSLMTESQRRASVNETRRPMVENLGWIGQTLGRVMQGIQFATSDIGNKVGLAVQGQERDIEPYKINMNNMADRAATLMTGFTSDRQAKLDILLTKVQRQFQLEDREWNLMQELAKEEREFNKTKEAFTYQSDRGLQDYEAQKKIDLKYKPGSSGSGISFGNSTKSSSATFKPTEPKPPPPSNTSSNAASFYQSFTPQAPSNPADYRSSASLDLSSYGMKSAPQKSWWDSFTEMLGATPRSY